MKNNSMTVKKSIKTKIICVSHEEDADGISSAALVKQAFGGSSILVDYPGMIDSMEPLIKRTLHL
jgi:RecJ-like exonuclease